MIMSPSLCTMMLSVPGNISKGAFKIDQFVSEGRQENQRVTLYHTCIKYSKLRGNF